MTNSSIAIIPARGGSKGVPRKNVRPLAGKPLIAWTIEAALASRLVDSTVVSTDDPEIARISEAFGASVVWRPESISGDMATSEDALIHALQHLESIGVKQPALTVFLQCTSPLTVSEDIDGTIDALLEGDADTALSVADFHYFLWKDQESGGVTGVNHDKSVRQLRQERTPQYLETGAVYVMRTKEFLERRHRFFGVTARYVMPSDRVLEIDDPVDFEIADVLLGRRASSERARCLPNEIDVLVFDFDGVFTDDRVYLSQDGVESVACSRADGMGIKIARECGMRILILSTEENPVVAKRAEKLKLEVIQGVADKQTILDQWLTENQLDWGNVVYVGNDINDVDCLLRAGCGIVPSSAHPAAKRAANVQLSREGGCHAVREVIDLILERDKKDSRR